MLKKSTMAIALLLASCHHGEQRPLARFEQAKEPATQSRRIARGGPIKLERATNPDEAMRWRRLHWVDEDGRIPEDGLRRAIEQRNATFEHAIASLPRSRSQSMGSGWVERGPYNVGGRTRSLIVHPNDPNRIWAGAVSGGIWYSDDAGASWSPADDWLPNLAICCLTLDPADPTVLYAGTGEGFFNGDAIGGAGIYKSTDDGETWSQLPSTADWDNVNRIAVSPDDSNVLLAAKRYGGIQRSTDGGVTWTNPQWAQGSFYVAFHPTDGSKAIAHLIDWDWDLARWYHHVVYSADGGVTWHGAAGLAYVPGFGSRIELTYAPSQPNIVYASVATDGGKIWRSTDGGHSYTLRTISGQSGVSWYANPIWVDPADPDVLVTGGFNFYRSTDGGATLQQISSGYIMTQQPHVDNHFIVEDPGYDGLTNRRVYVCTDGGVWRTDDIYTASTNSGWEPIDAGYRTVQYYGAAGDGPSDLIVGGTQDNGTLRIAPGSTTANLTFGGDGGFCAVDWTDPDYVYGEYINLRIHRSTDGGLSASYLFDGIADAGERANFIAPFILDPNDPNTLLAGGESLWRSTNVKATQPDWTAIRGPGSAYISAIAVAVGDSDIIWVGQNDGGVSRTSTGTAANPTWWPVDDNGAADPLPDRYVTRVVIDPDDADTVYVSFGGFSGENLWKTIDGGQSWTDITGSGAAGLPDAPIRGVARHPHPRRADWLYVGTEVGVFTSTDSGQTWSTNNDGPALVSVDELVFMHDSTTLLAATHGRGIFTLETGNPLSFDFDDDGDIDGDDYLAFDSCFTGEGGGPVGIDCQAGDGDGDGDVDCDDWSGFELAWTEPTGPPVFERCLPSVCGDGEVTGGESCDTAIAAGQPGACPTNCDTGDPCVIGTLVDAGTCTARCEFTEITEWIDGDGCCPSGANEYTDGDCAPLCGNGVCETSEPATCPADCQCVTNADCDDHYACTFDACVEGQCGYASAGYGDADGNGALNLFDIFCVLDGIAGEFSTCTSSAVDLHPCQRNGVINLFDVFAVLDAIGGIDPCCAG